MSKTATKINKRRMIHDIGGAEQVVHNVLSSEFIRLSKGPAGPKTMKMLEEYRVAMQADIGAMFDEIADTVRYIDVEA